MLWSSTTYSLRANTNSTRYELPPNNIILVKWFILPFISTCSLFSATIVVAQTWDGGGGANRNGSTASNWNPDGVPANNGTASLTFDGVNQSPFVDVPWSVNSIIFPSTAQGFNIQGSTLSIGVGGIRNDSVPTNPNVRPAFNFTTAIVLTGPQTWSSPGNNNAGLDFSGPINLGTHTLTIAPLGNGSSGVYVRARITGSGGLIVQGFLVLYPRGHDYTGGTTIESGGDLFGTAASLQGNFNIAPTGTMRFGDVLDGSKINGTFHGIISGSGTVSLQSGAEIGFDPADSTSIGANISLLVSTTLVAAAPGSLNFGRLFAANATLDMGTGTNAVSFANSSGQSWFGQTLTITNYLAGSDSLRFGTSSSGLTATQLALLRFAGYGMSLARLTRTASSPRTFHSQ